MKSLLLFSALFISTVGSAQNMILNPGFENHALPPGCLTNQTDVQVTTALDNVTAFYFGTSPGIDIGVNAACYAGGANSGATHIVLARLFNEQMSEAFSFDLTNSIVAGNTYNISFYAANSNVGTPETLLIGVSGSQTAFGTQVSAIPLGSSALYVQYSASFVAPSGGAYLTIQPLLSDDFWFGLDDFYLENTCTSTSGSSLISACDAYTVPSGDETYVSTGVYNDTIPNAAGCDSILTLDVTVNPLPIVSYTADVLIGCAPLSVVFTNTSTATAGLINNCQWDFGNGVSDVGCTTLNYIYNTPGLYSVTLTTTTDLTCTDSITYTDYILVNDCAGIDELNTNTKELVKIVDPMGRETTPQKNRVLIYMYSDGTIKRVFEFE
jgi:PKD repeat protein